jgi:hypothetical protein
MGRRPSREKIVSWRDAPLYVESHDLARWVLERTGAWSERSTSCLAKKVEDAACDLVSEVALASTFPVDRAHHLQEADAAVVRLRIFLRLARDVGIQSPGGVRYAAGRLRAIGRMIGGWRKRVLRQRTRGDRRKEERLIQESGPPVTRPA